MPDYFLPKLRPTARIRAFLSTSLLEPHKISRKKVLKEVGKETQLETEAAASSNCVLAFSLLVMFDSDPCFWYFVHVKGIHLLKWTVLPSPELGKFVWSHQRVFCGVHNQVLIQNPLFCDWSKSDCGIDEQTGKEVF